MPYVEVWVDDVDCDGTCGAGREVKRRRDFAVGLLFEGKVNEAIDALTKGDIPEGWRVDADLQARYLEWTKGEMKGLDGPALNDEES